MLYSNAHQHKNNRTLIWHVIRLITLSVYISDNKIDGFQHFHDSVQSRHHFVQGTVGHLSPSDHDRAPSNRTMGYSVLKTLNGKSHPLVHEVVQVHGVTRHFRHHINLWTIKTDLRVWFSLSQKNMSAPVSLTDNLWLHESVAVVTVASSGSMQAQDYLIPLSILTEMLDEKVYPLGVPPIMSFRPRHLHVMPLHKSGSQEDSLKHVAPRMRWLVWSNSSRGITPLPARSIMKSIVAKWLASRVAFFIDRTEPFPSLIPFFFWVCSGVSRSRLSLAHPPLPSTISIVLGPRLFVLIFFVTDSVEDKPVCHIYQWIAHPTHGSLCNHCDRWWMGTR